MGTRLDYPLKEQVPSVPFLRHFLVRSVLANEHANTWGQGCGRYRENYIVQRALKDLEHFR